MSDSNEKTYEGRARPIGPRVEGLEFTSDSWDWSQHARAGDAGYAGPVEGGGGFGIGYPGAGALLVPAHSEPETPEQRIERIKRVCLWPQETAPSYVGGAGLILPGDFLFLLRRIEELERTATAPAPPEPRDP